MAKQNATLPNSQTQTSVSSFGASSLARPDSLQMQELSSCRVCSANSLLEDGYCDEHYPYDESCDIFKRKNETHPQG